MNATASRFSRPPNLLGIHSPALAAVVEVEHRGDRVDAQAVGVEFAEPPERAGDEEIAHFVAAVVENVGIPVGMIALARVEMLVQRGAVEAAERERVLGKMRGTQSRITPIPR
jgi:hypothetical protein